MTIKAGAADIADIKLGTTQIAKVMAGTVEIWPMGKMLSGNAAEFLADPRIIDGGHFHTNSGKQLRMEDLREDKVFPDGRRVYVGGYEMTNHQKYADAGFTVAGPHGGVASTGKLTTAAAITCADGHKMLYMPLIREINGYGGGRPIAFDCFVDGRAASGSCMGQTATCSGYTTIGQDAVNKWATGEGRNPPSGLARWIAVKNESIYGWLYCLDDCRTKLRGATTNKTYRAMRDYDNAHAPAYAAGGRVVGDFGLQDSYYPNNTTTRARLAEITFTISQNYYHGGDFAGDGDGYHKSRLMIGKWAENLKAMCDQVAPNNGKPRVIVQGWLYAFAWDAVVSHNSDPAYYRKEYMHDMLLAMMKGCNGLHFYQTRPGYTNQDARSLCEAEWTLRTNAMLDSLKKIAVDEHVLSALLWGKRTGHQHAITKSSTPAQKFGNDSEFSADAITMADVQFMSKRYVIVTNSQQPKEVTDWWNANPDGVVSGRTNPAVAASGCDSTYRRTWGATTPSYWHWYNNAPPSSYGVSFTLSGFKLPDGTGLQQLLVREIISGKIVTPDSNGRISVRLEPLESAVFVVEAAPGFGGPPITIVAPVITTQPANRTVESGATATFTVAATSAAPLSYRWQHDTGSGWAPISGATASSYTTPALAVGDSGNRYRCVVTNSAGSAWSNAATLTVRDAAFNPAITAYTWSLAKDYPTTITFNGTVESFNTNLIDIYVIWGSGTVDGPKYFDSPAKSGNTLTWKIATSDGVNYAAQRVVFKAGAVVVNGVALPAQTIQFPPA